MDDSNGDSKLYDLAVIGGGINGCGIAADAAGRGLDVILIEQGDLAAGTSSASSKLIHGGLRYLEHHEFRLVREALQEREILLGNAPHIVRPLRFVVPHVEAMRSRLMIRAGLFLYDHLARRKRVPGSGIVDLSRDAAGLALAREYRQGFSYWDCSVDDARLVIAVAQQAFKHGARILTRAKVTSAVAEEDHWRVSISRKQTATGHEISGSGGAALTGDAEAAGRSEVFARILVNAAGPWAGLVGQNVIRRGHAGCYVPVRLVKGSHIVVPRIAGADGAYLLQANDGRVVFLLPFAGRFTLIGTTDMPFSGDPSDVAISADEEAYLLNVANSFLERPLSLRDVVWKFAGVRPLFDDHSDNPSAVSRDYKLEVDAPSDGAALLTVVGGKVTTYRRLAEAAMQLIEPYVRSPFAGAWTAHAPLPGGAMPDADLDAYASAFFACYPHMPKPLLLTLLHRYGTAAVDVLGDAKSVADLGEDLGGGLSKREISYLRDHEWARTAEDVLWRRTKAGLAIAPEKLAEAEDQIARCLVAGGRQ